MDGAPLWVGDDPTASKRDCRGRLAVDVPDQSGALKRATGIEPSEAAQAGLVLLGREVDVVCVGSEHRACSRYLRGRPGGLRPDVLGVQRLGDGAPAAAAG